MEATETFKVLEHLKEKLGIPDQIISDSVFYNAADDKVNLILKNVEQDNVKIQKTNLKTNIWSIHYILFGTKMGISINTL